MKERKLNLGTLIGGILLLLVGILILCNQDAFVKIVVICASIAAFVDGIYTLVAYRQWQFTQLTSKLTLIKGILMLVSGIIGVIMPLVAAHAVVTVVVYVFAAMLVYAAFVSIQDAFVLKKIDADIPRGHFYLEALFSVVVAVIFFSDPYKILNAFVIVIAICAVVVGLGLGVYSFLKKD